MIWMWILLVALITLGAIVLFGKLPAAARPLAVAAVMVARTGKTALAAQTLEKGLERYPDNVDLWVGLGNALVAHGGGVMSPAAALAFDEAAKRDPNHPAPPFFAGLAMAQSGDLKGADAVWSQLLARTPPDAPWRADLEMRLAQLRQAMGPDLSPNAPTGP